MIMTRNFKSNYMGMLKNDFPVRGKNKKRLPGCLDSYIAYYLSKLTFDDETLNGRLHCRYASSTNVQGPAVAMVLLRSHLFSV